MNRRRQQAFTLIELLVVISIIGLLAAISLPALKGFGKSNAVMAANRQLLDDVAYARRRAISERADVYMVFVSPGIVSLNPAAFSPKELQVLTNLLAGQYTTYALFATRQVGEQPGHSSPRYLSAWRTLPNGIFIPTAKFGQFKPLDPDYSRAFPTNRTFPFPRATSSTQLLLPYVGFDYQGRLLTGQDEVIPLARGSVFYARDANGQLVFQAADPQETPPNNSISNSNHIRIDWLTGRARVERQELQ